ncbi:NAD(P)/FAD-dependent oxidoreductase [Amaricoccus macauensis]|uniref:NAD(P)/FAD-dependent oxidoreductase n=1 Tax=Amaricoccus macauensis TaxID=57001 RepID=UPI003C7AF498
MSLDAMPVEQQRVAIIGGGISGLAAAYLMAPQYAVTLFEASPRLGGHARTVFAGKNGDRPVDTGFIVFNYANYPHLTRMFRDLQVPVTRSDMSFGASIDNGRVEYGLRDLQALVAQKGNLARPGFARMVRDIFRFNAHAETVARDDNTTIGELMVELKLGSWFRNFYLLPLCGAIWSTPPSEIQRFPARALVQFFRNHALLSPSGQHQWWTVDGGSIEYVRRLEHHLRGLGVGVRTRAPVRAVIRDGRKSIVQISGQDSHQFDHVVFACHSDQALKLLAQPTLEEHRTLSAIKFQDNEMVLHRDAGQMPRRKAVWSSWIYKSDTARPEPAISVTYWMNRLQNIPECDPLFVSLNPSRKVPEELIYDRKTFRHPVFDTDALSAQKRLTTLQGQNNTWFAGAYTRHGFHEDGFASAVRIARLMNRQFV